MKLYDMTMKGYIEKLKSSEPAPGGGSASAFCGAQGAALIAMVARLTLEREKYAEFWPACEEAAESCDKLSDALLQQSELDTSAYLALADAFRMAKRTEQERSIRAEAIEKATVYATQVPLETMRLGLSALRIASALQGKFNANAASDYGVAIANLLACLKGASMNVEINLPGIKNETLRNELQSEEMAILHDSESLALR